MTVYLFGSSLLYVFFSTLTKGWTIKKVRGWGGGAGRASALHVHYFGSPGEHDVFSKLVRIFSFLFRLYAFFHVSSIVL